MTNLKIWRAQRTTVSSAIPSMLSKHSSSKSYKINVNIKPWHEQKYLQSDSILINGVQKWSKNNETLGKTRASHLRTKQRLETFPVVICNTFHLLGISLSEKSWLNKQIYLQMHSPSHSSRQ